MNLVKFIHQYPFWPLIKPYRRKYLLGLISLAAVDGINVALPLIVKFAVDSVTVKLVPQIFWAAFLYLLLMILQSWGRYLWRIYLMGTSHQVAKDLRVRLYGHLQELPYSYYQSIRTGDLMSRTTNDVESVRMAIGPGVLVATDAFFLFALILPVMFSLSWKLSLYTLAFYPLVPLITYYLGDKIDKLFTRLQEKMSELSSFAQESFQGIRWIKSFVLEKKVSEKFRMISEEYQREGMKLAKYEAIFSPSLGLITDLGTFLILILGGREVLLGTLTLGTLVAFQRIVVQLAWPMEAIGWAVTMHREGLAAIRRVDSVLSVPEVESVKKGISLDLNQEKTAVLYIPHLYFSYPGSLFNLKLEKLSIHSTKKIGIVGPVGSGKTTLLNLFLRLYEPPPGSVYYRGKDILSIPLHELRNELVSVEQQIFLFSESIRDNLLSKESEVSQIKKICETVQINEEINLLEKKYETVLGERGVNLSGGQKQRLALARALNKNPKILLLDDCFSAVDVPVEQVIIQNLMVEYSDLTLVIATHRLSIMPLLDEIWVLDNGQIKDRGTHTELILKSPLYQELWEKSRLTKEPDEIH